MTYATQSAEAGTRFLSLYFSNTTIASISVGTKTSRQIAAASQDGQSDSLQRVHLRPGS